MTPIQILRIEDNDGHGMFIGGRKDAYDLIPDACNRHFTFKSQCLDTYFPRPEEDEGLKIRKDGKEWFCAFISLSQLNSLIYPEEVKKLLTYGYNVLILTVTNYQTGKYQVLFTRDSITETKNLNSIF